MGVRRTAQTVESWLDSVAEEPRRALLIVLAVALAIRLGVVIATPSYEPVFDSGDYDLYATSIAAGDGFPDSQFAAGGGPTAFRPPLFPVILGGVYAVVGENAGVDAGRIVGALFGVVVVWLVFLVGARIWGNRTGLIAAAIAAVFPPLAFLNAALVTEPLFLALELAVVLAALATRAAGGDWRLAALTGVFCGLAALTRSNGVLLVVPAALCVWTAKPRFSRSALVTPAIVAVATVLTLVPWSVRNSLVFDRVVPMTTQTGFALAGAYTDEARDVDGHRANWVLPTLTERYEDLFARTDLNEAELDSKLQSRAVEYAADDPLYVVETSVLNGLRSLSLIGAPEIAIEADRRQLGLGANSAAIVKWTFFALGLLVIAGAIALLRAPREGRGPLVVWHVPVLMLAAAVWIIGSTRYRAPIYPFMAILAAVAIVDLVERLARSDRDIPGSEREADVGVGAG